jgi:hypothetical protein
MAFVVHKILVNAGRCGGLHKRILATRVWKVCQEIDEAINWAQRLEASDRDWDVANLEDFFIHRAIDVRADGEGCPCAVYRGRVRGMSFVVDFPLDAKIRSCACIMDEIAATIDAIINGSTRVQVIETEGESVDSASGRLRYESRLMVDLDALREAGKLRIDWEECCCE